MYSYSWLLPLIIVAACATSFRCSSIGLGTLGGLGLCLFTLVGGIAPVEPPFSVLLIILSTITAASALEAAGSLAYLAARAGRVVQCYPLPLTFLSSLVTYLLVLCMGTSHILYPLLPIIAKLAKEDGVRPERPLVASVLASQHALLASPLSAANATILEYFAPYGYTLPMLLAILLPTTLAGSLAVTAWCLRPDPTWQDKAHSHSSTWKQEATWPRGATHAWLLFLIAAGIIIMEGSFPTLRQVVMPQGHCRLLPMAWVVSMTMMGSVGIMLLLGYCTADRLVEGEIFGKGMQATVAILGISWLGNTFLTHYHEALFGPWVAEGGWQWAPIAFVMTLFSNSQGATLQLLLPLALKIGTAPGILLCCLPAVNSYYVFATYPTILTAIAHDPTGSTYKGRWLSHSFLLPGLIGTLASCITACCVIYLLA